MVSPVGFVSMRYALGLLGIFDKELDYEKTT